VVNATISEIYADVFLTTGPFVATKKEKVVSEITRRTFFNNYVMKGFPNGGGSMMDMFNGGEIIQDTILLDEFNTFMRYDPEDEFSYPSGEVLTNWEVPYRYAKAHLKFTKHERRHNTGGRVGGGMKGMFHQYKNLFRTKEQNFWANVCNSLEDEWFNIPSNADMEAKDGKIPYSLPCGVNDYVQSSVAGEDTVGVTTTGLAPAGVSGTAWTTLQGIDPAVKTKWQAQHGFYYDVPQGNDWTGWPAFSRLWKRLKFGRMPKREELGEGESFPGAIFTSEEGATMYEIALVAANDPLSAATMGRGNGAIQGPLMYKTAPVEYLESMTSGVFYADAIANGATTGPGGVGTAAGRGAAGGGAGVANFVPEFTDSVDFDDVALVGQTFTVGGTTFTIGTPENRTGPRFKFLNNEYLRTFFPEGEMFETVKVKPSRQPHSTVLVTDIWNNNYFRSLRRMGEIIPGIALGRVA